MTTSPYGPGVPGAGTNRNTGQTTTDDSFAALMNLFGNNKGLFGLGDLGTMGLFSFGGSLLSGLGSLLAGESPGEKRTKETYGLARNRLGQSVIEPEQYLADFYRTATPRIKRQGETIERRLGLDVGVAQGELWSSANEMLADFLLQAKMQADILKSQRDTQLLQLMGSMGTA